MATSLNQLRGKANAGKGIWRQSSFRSTDLAAARTRWVSTSSTLQNTPLCRNAKSFVSSSIFPGLPGSGILHSKCLYELLNGVRGISSTSVTLHSEIGMPSLSPTMTQGNIAKWRKKEGDWVAAGDVLCEIETDKATLEFENMEEGFLAKILCGDGSKDIQVGQPIAILVDSEDEIANFKDYKTGQADTPKIPSPAPKNEDAAKVEQPSTVAPSAPKVETQPPMLSPDAEGRVRASPIARKIAEEKNVPLSSLKGSGPNGRIIKADIEEFLASAASTPSEPPAETLLETVEKLIETFHHKDIPHSQIRKITAQRLLLSKQTIPHYYLTVDTCVDNLLALRLKLNNLQETSGGKRISINDFVIKAAAMALKKVPECNSSWADDYIRQYVSVNISVAVQTDFGLLVPVVKQANVKGLAIIAEEVKSLADKAKKNSLKPFEYEGGTFTVSNLGGPFGVKQFCAIINPPQACILAVGTMEKRVVAKADGEFSQASFMSVTLSCDHRVVDGAIGARWLGAFKGFIEDPITMLL